MRVWLVLAALVLVGCSGSPIQPDVASVPTVGASSVRFGPMAVNDRYCFLITIDDLDKRNDVVALIRGSGSILDLVEGVDPFINPPDTTYEYYKLLQSLMPDSEERRAVAWVGINVGVPAVVRNEYSQNTSLWRTVEFGGGTFTRAFMQARVLQLAQENGCNYGWVIVPGDSLTGNLLAHFTPIL